MRLRRVTRWTITALSANLNTNIRQKVKVSAYNLNETRLVKRSVQNQRFDVRNDVQRVLRGAGADELEKLDGLRKSQTRRSHARRLPYIMCSRFTALRTHVRDSLSNHDGRHVLAQYL